MIFKRRIAWNVTLLLIVAVALAAGLSGCSPMFRPAQPAADQQIHLDHKNSIGQTFVAKYDGLQGLQVFLSPQTAGPGEIRLHLRGDPQASEDLAVASRPVDGITGPGFYHFAFPSQTGSRGGYYYAFLEIEGEGQVLVSTGPATAYLDGSLYEYHAPVEGQLSFGLVYDPARAALGFAREVANWVGALIVGLFLFITPGWALLAGLWPGASTLRVAEKLGLSAGVSLAIYPILFLWTHLVGLNLGRLYAWLPGVLGLAYLLWRWFRRRRRPAPDDSPGLKPRDIEASLSWKVTVAVAANTLRSPALLPDLALLAVLGLVIGTRLWAIRPL
ncbi:MAG: hypothetical protein EHM70_14625, partial [Chloroflexota bacterium]